MAEKIKHGQVCWNELATSDLGKAKEFYSALLGWKLEQSNAVKMEYPEIKVGEKTLGGMMQMTDEWKNAETGEFLMPSHWMTYIAVDDVDETARKVSEMGGKICVPPTDIAPVGRFSVINDPSGAFISIITLSNVE
ncbi:MAG: VOC family protein [Pyrinomonadaceae bacterium]